MQISVLATSLHDHLHWFIFLTNRECKIGLLGGLVLKLSGHKADLSIMETGFPNVFFLVLIAPIIYESAYNTNKKIFYANMGSILMYAFLGTFLASMVTTTLIYFLGYYGLCPV